MLTIEEDFINKLEFLGYLSNEEVYKIKNMYNSIGIVHNKEITITFYTKSRFTEFIEFTENSKLVNTYYKKEKNRKATFLPNSFTVVEVSLKGKQHGI